jgi:hypothetical protein
MDTCAACGTALDHTALDGLHPACFAERVPRDAAVAVLGGLVKLFGPLLAVWGC